MWLVCGPTKRQSPRRLQAPEGFVEATRNEREVRPVSHNPNSPVVKASLPPWTLRPYQIAAIRAIALAWQERQRTVLVLGTGLGKTTCFAEVALRRRNAKRGRCLVLAHRTELIEQAAERLKLAGLSCEIESGDNRAEIGGWYPSDVVVATVQTLKGKRLEQWPRDAFGTVVVDEVHHAVAASYRAILDRFSSAKILGVTATPDRGDGVALGEVFDHCAYEYSMREGIVEGFLAPIRQMTVLMPSVDMSTVRVTRQEHGRDYNPTDLAKQMTLDKSLHEMAVPIAQESSDRPTIVFVPTVQIAHELARVLAGYVGADKVASLDGTTDKQTRADVLGRYKSGAIRILVNCALFTEGFDAPSTACVVVARPTKSRALYAQMIGRGTRLAPGKADCLVLDLVPSNVGHELVCVVDLLAGKTVSEAERQAMKDGLVNYDDVLAAVEKSEAKAKAKAEELARERRGANMVANVKYKSFVRDPFAILGLDTPAVTDGRKATKKQRAELIALGLDEKFDVSAKAAPQIKKELMDRKRRGLCSLKQARELAKRGLRTDLTHAETNYVFDVFKATGWETTPELAEKYGA